MALAAGTRIGPYEVNELLGAGGMGEVYRAHDPRLGRQVAVKVLPARFAHSVDRLRRFEREARAAGALSHPNVLTVFDVGSQDGIHYLVSELLEGETLQTLLRTQRVGVRQSLSLAVQIAHGVACAHDAGILHRDLKPDNLFLTRDGRVKILDFGVAKLLQPEEAASAGASTATGNTSAGSIVGTAAYMSPEQIRDEPLDGRCDIFAVGAILYEMVARRPPFAGASGSDVMAAILRDDPPALASFGTAVPAAVEGLIRRCLEKRREDRLGSARELAVALETILDSFRSGGAVMEDGGAPRTDPRPDPPLSAPSAPTLIAVGRRRVSRAVVIAGIAVPILIGLVLLARERAIPPAPAPNSLAVMYFENLSDRRDTDSLGRMLTGLVTTDLAGSDGLQVVSSQRIHDITRQLGKSEGTPDRTVATSVARRAGAAKMVLGQVAQAGSRMVATAELVDVESGRLLGSYRAQGTGPQDVFSMAEGLAANLRANMTGRPPRPGSGGFLTQQLTASAEAYRAYVRGEAFLHRWELAKAAEEFGHAVKTDPEFALAHYRFSVAASSLRPMRLQARAAAERAVALKDKVPARDRGLVEGNLLYVTGRLSEAVPVLESALAREPEHKEILYLLSGCYSYSSRDANPRRAAELLERLLALDPEFHVVYPGLALDYALLGEFERAHRKLDEWEAKEPETIRTVRAQVTAWQGDLDEALRLSDATDGPVALFWRSRYALLTGRWDIARSIFRNHAGEGDLDPRLSRMQAHLHASLGEFDRAEALYRSLLPPHLEADEGYWGGITALAHHSLAELLALKGDLDGARGAAELALSVQPNGPFCLYFAGRIAIRAGDIAAAEHHLRRLEEVAKGARGPLVPHYRDVLMGEVALARGRPSEARPLLENAIASGKLRYEGWLFTPGPAFRDALANTYLAAGEKAKAAETLESLVSSGMDRVAHPVLYVRALYTLGRLKLDLGDEARGRELLQRFLEHWGKADWDLPEVRDARARLAPWTP